MSIYLGNTPLANNAVSRNIGEIIASTIPLTDAGLHLLDGSLISGSGSYSAFVTYIGGLVSSYPDLFETEANWQQSVTTYGVCGKFVYDSVNNTVRLPKITGFTEGTIDPTVLGDLVQAGLPNITGSISNVEYNTTSKPSFSGALFNTTKSGKGEGNGNYYHGDLQINASRSSSIYGKSNTVQPQAIKVLYYIVIATSTKTDIQVDIDEVMTDLNGKADVDLSNCTKPYVTETYVNGTSGYILYSNKYCEQWGVYNSTLYAGNTATISLLKNFRNTNYNVQLTGQVIEGKWAEASLYSTAIKTSSFIIMTTANSSGDATARTFWRACGYVS